MMEQTEHAQLEQMLAITRRRLQVLEEQAAGFGDLYIPPHVRTDLEQTRAKVWQLEQQLQQAASDPPDGSSPRRALDGTVTIHGGTFYGSIVGASSGSIDSSYTTPPTSSTNDEPGTAS